MDVKGNTLNKETQTAKYFIIPFIQYLEIAKL